MALDGTAASVGTYKQPENQKGLALQPHIVDTLANRPEAVQTLLGLGIHTLIIYEALRNLCRGRLMAPYRELCLYLALKRHDSFCFLLNTCLPDHSSNINDNRAHSVASLEGSSALPVSSIQNPWYYSRT